MCELTYKYTNRDLMSILLNRTDETLFGKTRVALTLCLWGRKILRQDIINNVEDSFIGDVRQL